MKKMLLNFADNLLSKEEQSKIKGGCGGAQPSCGMCTNSGDPYGGGAACQEVVLSLPLSPPTSFCVCPTGGGCGYYQ